MGEREEIIDRIIESFSLKDSFVGSTVNLINSVIGAGVLFLPYVILKCGIFYGLCAMVFGGVLVMFFMDILYQAQEITMLEGDRFRSFGDLGRRCYGFSMYWFIKFCTMLENFGVQITYLIVLSEMMVEILTYFTGWEYFQEYSYVVTAVVFAALFVASLSEKIRNYRFLSFLAITIVFFFFFVITILLYSGSTRKSRGEKIQFLPDIKVREGGWMFFRSVLSLLSYSGIITFSYFQTSTINIQSEYQLQNLYKMRLAITNSVIFCILFYIVISMVGYFSFLENTTDNIVKNYKSSWISIGLKIMIFFEIFFTFPIVNYLCALSLEEILFYTYYAVTNPFRKKKIQKNFEGEILRGKRRLFKFLRLGLLNVFICIIVYIIAVFYPYASTILNLIGSTVTVALLFILPVMFYVKLKTDLEFYKKILLIFFMGVVSIFFGFIPTLVNILETVFPHHVKIT